MGLLDAYPHHFERRDKKVKKVSPGTVLVTQRTDWRCITRAGLLANELAPVTV
jgi:hypothetical protein